MVVIAEQTGVVRSGEGPPSVAEYSFADAPSYDILLIPGGFGTRAATSARNMEYIWNEDATNDPFA